MASDVVRSAPPEAQPANVEGEMAVKYPILAPEVIDLGHSNQPCFHEGVWQAHDFKQFVEEWWVDPRCDCLPFGGIELVVGCVNCHRRATKEETQVFYATHGYCPHGTKRDDEGCFACYWDLKDEEPYHDAELAEGDMTFHAAH